MALSEKERKELKNEIINKYREKKHNKYPRGITLGDISRDMSHSDRREVADVANEITREK